MPSNLVNIININGSKELAWIVGDSKMEDLMKHLDEIGQKTELPR